MFRRRDSGAPERLAPPPPPKTGTAVARFMLGSLAAIAVVVVGGFFALRSIAIDDAEDDTREQVQIQGRLVEAAGLSDGVLRGEPAALNRLDALVLGQILSESVMRVKIWSEDGRILYSDEPALIGKRYGLGADERRLFREGGADAELSELSKPENRFERQEGKLLEAHTPIRTPNGTQVLFEIYQRFGSVSASGERLLRALAPPLLGGLLVLLLFQVPLAWSMAGRLQRGHREREGLLADAVEASTRERQRIAADLHDGVVQDLAGVAFGLAPLAEEAERRGAGEEASALRRAIARLRQGIRGLRTLLVEIHPPNLESAGSRRRWPICSARSMPKTSPPSSTSMPMPPDPTSTRSSTGSPTRRSATSGRTPTRARCGSRSHGRRPTTVRLVVEDDGRGFTESTREARAAGGHVGLSLLEGLVRQANGTLVVESAPGRGTRVELEVPAA